MNHDEEIGVIQVAQDKNFSVNPVFNEKYQYVLWSREEIMQMEDLLKSGLLEEYIEHRRKQALIAIGMEHPEVKGVTKRSASVGIIDESTMADAGDDPVLDASAFLKNVGEIFNIVNKTKIANVFQGLGLVLGCVDFFMTLLNPGQPDPTQQLIKQCFERMMKQLNVLSEQVSELKREVEWTAVKNALGESETNIRNALDKYNDLQNHLETSYEDEYMSDFLNFCNTINLENCMRTLVSAFTDRESAFGVKNLPEWALTNTKHNYAIMQKLFTVVCRMLLPAMHMHLFVCRSKGLDLQYESDRWAATLDQVKNNCKTQLDNVIHSLPSYIEEDFTTLFDQRGFGDLDNTWWSYMVISRDTHDFFKAKYPFANFGVVAYTSMWSFSNHCIGSSSLSKIFLHKGSNGVNVHILWEEAKATHDYYVWWLLRSGNDQKLQNDIRTANGWLDSHRSGDAESIFSSCPSQTSNARNYLAFIVPNSDVRYCNGTYKSSLTKFTMHQSSSTANGGNWNFVFQRFFGI